jgi:putative hemolysin
MAIIAAIITMSLIEYCHIGSVISFICEIVFVTLSLLIFGEVTPKIIARRFAIEFATFAAIPISFLIFLLSPITKLFEAASRAIQSFFKYEKRKSAINHGDIKYLTEIVDDQPHFDYIIRKLLQGISELNYLTAKDILKPRTTVAGYEITSSIDNLIRIINSTRQNMIPVYENNMDNIIGVVNIKDILRSYYDKNLSGEVIRESLKKPIFIPETKPLLDLLKEFQSTRTRIAIIIDEYGGTAGILSLGDIINYISDAVNVDGSKYEGSIIDRNAFIFDSAELIRDVMKIIHEELIIEDVNVNTIGGFTVHLFGHVPKVGEEIKYNNLTIKILDVKENHVKLIKISKTEQRK